jgi:catechol-2,3-dioxygenase
VEPRLSFVTLEVWNLDRATHFYEHVLKLPRIETPPSWRSQVIDDTAAASFVQTFAEVAR